MSLQDANFEQIEKFIETLFPSQTAEEAKLKLSGQSTEDEEKKKQQDKESWEDIKMMMIIMGGIITFITVLLVRTYFSMPKRIRSNIA